MSQFRPGSPALTALREPGIRDPARHSYKTAFSARNMTLWQAGTVRPMDDQPLVILGIPRAAWTHLKNDGVTHFGLSLTGSPVKLVLFGGKDQQQIVDTLGEAAKVAGFRLVEVMSQAGYFDTDHGLCL